MTMTNETLNAEALGPRMPIDENGILTSSLGLQPPSGETMDSLGEVLSALNDYLAHSQQQLRRLRRGVPNPDSIRQYVGEVDCRLGRFRRLLRSEFVRQYPQQALEHQQPPASSLSHDCLKAEKRLTKREREVLRLIVQGHTNKQGARALEISPRTFESHRGEIMGKLDAKNTAELVRMAFDHPDGLWLEPVHAIP